MPIRGVIFDLDNTLVASVLDFELMRREMGLASRLPLLEAIAELSPADAERCWNILAMHEQQGAERATLFAGVADFLQTAADRGLARAVLTRNCRAHARSTLARLALDFDPVMCREDGPVKPDPAAIWKICAAWGFAPSECVMIGDYRFDIEAGQRAGTHTVLFTGGGGPSDIEDCRPPCFVLASFAEPAALWQWLERIDLEGSGGCC
jgi:HAD superfamily hydrolase (TIGR01549 family)